MKEKDSNFKDIIMSIFLFPIAILFLLWLLLITPFDYIKYKRTRYYKDTHEKYSFLCYSSYYIKLYDLIKEANLPIDYYRSDYAPSTGYGYFIYKDTLILCDYEPYFDTEKNVWTVEVDDEYVDIKDDIESVIESCNNFLKDKVCNKAVVLIDSDLYNEHPNLKYELFDFLPVYNDDTIAALKNMLFVKDESCSSK